MAHPNNQHPGQEAPGTDLPAIEVAFAQALERGESLAEWIHQYPQHAIELTDLAIALVSTGEDERASEAEIESVSGMMHQAARQVLATPPQPPSPGAIARAQSLGMDVMKMTREVRLSADVLYQIDRGLVNLSTLPTGLVRQFSAVLKLPLDSLPDGLARPQASPGLFYTQDKPQAKSQISFAEALEDSEDLQAEDRDMWLAAAREEGLAS